MTVDPRRRPGRRNGLVVLRGAAYIVSRPGSVEPSVPQTPVVGDAPVGGTDLPDVNFDRLTAIGRRARWVSLPPTVPSNSLGAMSSSTAR